MLGDDRVDGLLDVGVVGEGDVGDLLSGVERTPPVDTGVEDALDQADGAVAERPVVLGTRTRLLKR